MPNLFIFVYTNTYREGQSRAKVLSNMVKQKRKEKAVSVYICTYVPMYTYICNSLKELGVLVAIIIRDEGLLSFSNMN